MLLGAFASLRPDRDIETRRKSIEGNMCSHLLIVLL